jgi:hypothetical protein
LERYEIKAGRSPRPSPSPAAAGPAFPRLALKVLRRIRFPVSAGFVFLKRFFRIAGAFMRGDCGDASNQWRFKLV